MQVPAREVSMPLMQSFSVRMPLHRVVMQQLPRKALENQIKTKAEAAAKSQTKISGADIAQFNSLIQGVIQQEVVKMKVICENSEQAGGRYKTHIVVEVTKASVLTNIVNSAKSDEKLKANFEEGKFKQAF